MKDKKILFFLFPVGILFLVTAVVMWLWNAILPEVLGAKNISYWQAMGILVLCRILFGGFHGRKKLDDFRHRHLQNKMQNMTPEEKERLKEIWKKRFAGNFCGPEK